jgi:hypothetical protein
LPPPVDPKHTADLSAGRPPSERTSWALELRVRSDKGLDAEFLEVFVSQKVDPDGGLVP